MKLEKKSYNKLFINSINKIKQFYTTTKPLKQQTPKSRAKKTQFKNIISGIGKLKKSQACTAVKDHKDNFHALVKQTKE